MSYKLCLFWQQSNFRKGGNMSISGYVQTYLGELRAYNRKTDSEHTYRADLENLFDAICDDVAGQIRPWQEIKDNQPRLGIPDFSFMHKENSGIIGLVEVKKIDTNLSPIVQSPQIKKYRKRCENIIITNYLDFILLKDGKIFERVTLRPDNEIKDDFDINTIPVEAFAALFNTFLSQEPKGISTTRELAEQLAMRCHDLREFLTQSIIQNKKTRIKRIWSISMMRFSDMLIAT